MSEREFVMTLLAIVMCLGAGFSCGYSLGYQDGMRDGLKLEVDAAAEGGSV